LHIIPDDQTLLYDLALTQEEWGIRVLQKSKASRTYAEVKQASVQLESASQIYTRLTELHRVNEPWLRIPEKALNHSRFVNEALALSKPHLDHAYARDQEIKQLQVEAKQQRDLLEAKLQAERDAIEAVKKEEEDRLAELAKADQALLDQRKVEWSKQADIEKEKADNRRQRNAERKERGGTGGGDEEEEAGTGARYQVDSGDRPKVIKKKKKKAGGGEGEKKKKPKKKPTEEGDAESIEEAAQRKARKKEKKAKKDAEKAQKRAERKKKPSSDVVSTGGWVEPKIISTGAADDDEPEEPKKRLKRKGIHLYLSLSVCLSVCFAFRVDDGHKSRC
jgi:hypothetical protein